MTKEMHPSHRIDILTDAIIYYCQKRIYRDKAKLDKAKESIHSFIHTYVHMYALYNALMGTQHKMCVAFTW